MQEDTRVQYGIFIELDQFADPKRYPNGIAWRSGVLDDEGSEIDGEGDIATYEEARRLALDTLTRLLDRAHIHSFEDQGARTDSGETIEHCTGCDASRDSSGGIIQ